MHFFWVLCLCVCNKKDCCVQTLCTQLQIICTLSKLLFQCELLLVFRKSANIILISMWTIINLLEIFQQNDYFMRTIIKISRVNVATLKETVFCAMLWNQWYAYLTHQICKLMLELGLFTQITKSSKKCHRYWRPKLM